MAHPDSIVWHNFNYTLEVKLKESKIEREGSKGAMQFNPMATEEGFLGHSPPTA